MQKSNKFGTEFTDVQPSHWHACSTRIVRLHCV